MASAGSSLVDRVGDEEILTGTGGVDGRGARGRQSWWWVLSLIIVFGVWQVAAWRYDSDLLMPQPVDALRALGEAVVDPIVLTNLGITVRRVLIGFVISMAIGVPVGYLMGHSPRVGEVMDPLINTFRQVPIMAWVPLSIIWFGLGDGPTIFIITFVGVFAIILSTVAGVRAIPIELFHAARSMGASRSGLFRDVVLPATVPDVVTGARLALGAAWGSVICAEFIATSAGYGYLMVRAQSMMATDRLMALMILGALVGFLIDRGLVYANRQLAKWRYLT